MQPQIPAVRHLPLLAPAAAFSCGVALSRSDALAPLPALVAVLIFLFALLHTGRKMVAALLLLGLLWGGFGLILDARKMAADPSWWTSGPVTASASIVSVQRYPTSLRLRLDHVVRDDGVRLAGEALAYFYGNSPDLKPGYRIHGSFRWHQPENYRNPGAFDYRAWCFDHHLALLGSLTKRPTVVLREHSWLAAARQRLRQDLTAATAPGRGILQALLLGDRSALDVESQAVFAATGTSHLLAISGLHVGLVGGWFFILFRWILTRREHWIVALPVGKLSLSAACVGALAYATLASWPLPVVRAVWMLCAAVLAWWLQERTSPLNTLLAGLMLILLFDPAAIASVSLWLSFVATAALLLYGFHGVQHERQRRQPWSMLRAAFLTSAVASLATLPLILRVFGQLPVYGLAANVLAVPWYGLVVMPLALGGAGLSLCGLDVPAQWIFQRAADCISWAQSMLDFLASLPLGMFFALAPSWWVVLGFIGMLIAAVWLWQKHGWKPMLGMVSVAIMLLLVCTVMEKDRSHPVLMVWDVGQGASSSLLLPAKRVLTIDVPGRPGSRFNGGNIVASGLRELGLTHVDVLAITHAQSDHLGGALNLMRHVNKVGNLWLADVPSVRHDARVQAILAEATRHETQVRWLARGDRLALGMAAVEVLWPPRDYQPANTNNASLVLKVVLPEIGSMIFPGDIEKQVEHLIAGNMQDTTLVSLMPHHGSRTSSTRTWVAHLRPSVVIAQTGRYNRYGFPKNEIVQRYLNAGSRVMNTAKGAVEIAFDLEGKIGSIKQWQAPYSVRREFALRWWQGRL